MNLDEIRQKIDEIDRQLVPLLAARMDCSETVAQIKQREGLPVLHPEREQKILDKVREAGGKRGDQVAAVYREIMQASRALQLGLIAGDTPLKAELLSASNALPEGSVACFGAEGAFCHAVARHCFPEAPIGYFGHFADVFEAVESGRATLGVVPVENSNAGSVGEVYDLILRYRHFIVTSAVLPVRQNLLSVPGATLEEITDVYSHPQGLSQCAAFLQQHHLKAHECDSTAAAAKQVAEWGDRQRAAIASDEAARVYGLAVLRPSIQTVQHNFTRFIVISKRLVALPNSNKISVVFTVPHVTGSLYQVLDRFAMQGLNLTKIESRAAGNGNFEYQFYLDFAGRATDAGTVSLLSALSVELPQFSFLGNYPEIELA